MAGSTFGRARGRFHGRSSRVALISATFAALVAAISACSPSGVLSLQPTVDIGTQTAAVAPARAGMQNLLPRNPFQAAYPRMDQPGMYQPGMTEPDMMSAADLDCRRDLKKLDVTFKDLPSISNGGSCGIAHPVSVSDINGV